MPLMIDPPAGWEYGFPKPAPPEYFEPGFDINAWLVKEGYPAEKVYHAFSGQVPCGFFNSEDIDVKQK